ncbi:MAG: serine hydrolase [Bryobacterales bacterium]|nr:serine hydrolase [Bryobacterales bacterium]
MILRSTIVALCTAAALLAQDYSAKAQAYVESWVRDGQFSGAVLVMKDGQPLVRKGYGLANREWNIPNAPDTKFRLGSITKQFTAAAILQLAEQGKLSIDDPVSKHYPESPAAWEKITIHHLLNHTSGIPSYTAIPDFFQKQSMIRRSPAEIVKLTQDKPLEFDPGAKYAYNNTGYVLLGHIIERLSGQSYDAYLRKHVLDPLGLKDSGYDWNTTVIPRRASGYNPDGAIAPYLDMSLPHAAGSLYATIDDLAKWMHALESGKVVSKDHYAKMTTAYRNNYGYGLMMTKIENHDVIGHGGGINGFNTSLLRAPADNLTVAVLANQAGPAADTIARELAAMYFGKDVKPRALMTEIKLPAEKLDSVAGQYELRPGFVLKVWREGDQLMTQATGQGKLPLQASAEDRFFSRMVGAEIVFQRDAAGNVTSLVLHQGGRQIPGKRIGD